MIFKISQTDNFGPFNYPTSLEFGSQPYLNMNSYLIGSHHDVLVPEWHGHDSDEQAKEGLQLPQAVLVQAQEGESVGHGD